MRYNDEWRDYKAHETGNGQKLESYGDIYLLRPDPQIIWKEPYDLSKDKRLWASYERSAEGGGKWRTIKPVPNEFYIRWRNLTFSLKLMGFKHTGIFPEQAYNWAKMIKLISETGGKPNVLNLFAYTGGATLACVSAGAKVCHVDAAKSMCERAGKNIALSGLPKDGARFIVDDCFKFVERELRRGNTYDAVIMDPPSYGRGPKGETWKLEDKIYELVELTKGLMSENPLFYLINSYTTGLQPTAMKNILELIFKDVPHCIEAYELGIKTERENIILPSGASAFMTFATELK